MPYWNRFLAGEHETVWAELMALGERVHEPGIREQAQAIAGETARRATENLRTLARRLEMAGYRFEEPAGGAAAFAGINLDFGSLHTHFQNMPPEAQKKMGGPGIVNALQSMMGMLRNSPTAQPRKVPPVEPAPADAKRALRDIEEILEGKLPLSLRAWYEHADGVSFIGIHEQLNPPETLSDPIVMMPLDELLEEIEGCADQGYPGPVALAPDDLHKANISGATWDMELPCARADAPFGRWPGFVAYLREVCAWGGFPGWSREANPPRELIASLTQDLLPF